MRVAILKGSGTLSSAVRYFMCHRPALLWRTARLAPRGEEAVVQLLPGGVHVAAVRRLERLGEGGCGAGRTLVVCVAH